AEASKGLRLRRGGLRMFASKQYRVKAAEYAELVKKSTSPIERREFQELEKSFSVLADNEQWMEEEHVLRCLGAALIMQWNTLPTKLQRELFDNAGSMGECWSLLLSEDKSLTSCTSTRMTGNLRLGDVNYAHLRHTIL